MTADTYVNRIVRKIKCGQRERTEMKKQLSSDIAAALEQGETLEQIMQRMGEAKAVAEEINFNLPVQSVKKYEKNRHRRLVIGVLAMILLVTGCLVWWYVPKAAQIDENSIFDGAVVEAQTKQVILYLNEKKYDTLQQMSNEQMQAYVTKELLEQACSEVSKDWGAFRDFSSVQMTEVEQQGMRYVVAAVNASYEKVAVSFTVSFDQDMKLAGLYMR